MVELPEIGLPGGIYALIAGQARPASHVRGQDWITVEQERISRSAVERLFQRTVSGTWKDEPVTVWGSSKPGMVKVQYAGTDWTRAQQIGMRGDRTMWEADVLPDEVAVTGIEETDIF